MEAILVIFLVLKAIAQSSKRELDFFFGETSPLRTTALFDSCSCGVIKPHILGDKQVGKVLDMVIQGGFEISGLELFCLDKPTAEEFMCVYKVSFILGIKILGGFTRI